MTLARYHAIERTSPKGEGHEYVGTCWQCGKTGLTLADAREFCENVAALTVEESLIMAIGGPEEENAADQIDHVLSLDSNGGFDRALQPVARRALEAAKTALSPAIYVGEETIAKLRHGDTVTLNCGVSLIPASDLARSTP